MNTTCLEMGHTDDKLLDDNLSLFTSFAKRPQCISGSFSHILQAKYKMSGSAVQRTL